MLILFMLTCPHGLLRALSGKHFRICGMGLLCLFSLLTPAVAQIGQSSVDDTKTIIAVGDIQDPALPDIDFVGPKDGYRFLAIHVALDNTEGAETVTANPFYFKLKDHADHLYPAELLWQREPALESGDVKPGDRTAGWITFQVPIGLGRESLWLRYDAIFKKSAWIALSAEGAGEQPRTARELFDLGREKDLQGDYKQAQVYYAEAVRLEPQNPLYLMVSGIVCYRLGEYQNAIAWYEQALTIQKKTLGEQHTEVAETLINLGIAWGRSGDYQKALGFYEQALAIQRYTYGDTHPDIATTLSNIGNAKQALQAYHEAITAYEQALSIYSEVDGEPHPEVGQTLTGLATTWAALGEYDQAIRAFQDALKIAQQVYGADHPQVAIASGNLGNAYRQANDTPNALASFKQAETIFVEKLGEQHPYTQQVRNTIRALENQQ